MNDTERVTGIGPDGSAHEFDPDACGLADDAPDPVMLVVDRDHWYDLSPPQPVEVVVTAEGETRVFHVKSVAYGYPNITMNVRGL